MKRYQQYIFSNITAMQSEIISGLLSDLDTAGVEETDHTLTVYFEEQRVHDDQMEALARIAGAGFTASLVDDQNWNSLWESNFEPVTIDDFVSIRADFHQPVKGVEYDIVITPKMSFGTGHHATTWSMISQMRTIDFKGRSVFDFGTGTGILAILAGKLGAAGIRAIDIDDWSIENARENFIRNEVTGVDLERADTPAGSTTYDIILANINRNILLEHMAALKSQLSAEGILLLSGLLSEDEADIVNAASETGLVMIKKSERSGWICLRFSPGLSNQH